MEIETEKYMSENYKNSVNLCRYLLKLRIWC